MFSLRDASCCRVEVMKGGAGARLTGFASIDATVGATASTAAVALRAAAASARSYLPSVLPSKVVSRASNASPRGVLRRALTDQYSLGRNASISISRSTIMRSATDCTRPADFAPGSLRHRTGDSLYPTR